jgi:hypothetical protein
MDLGERLRLIRVELAVVFGLTAALFAWPAIDMATTSSWPDQSSPPFALAPGSHGAWSPSVEATSGSDRARPLVLWHEATRGHDLEAIDLVVRVEPVTALMEYSRRAADADGWVRFAVDSSVALGIAEPADVRRIEWRVGNVSPVIASADWTFYIPGSPDSEHPELWPFLALISGACAAASIGLAAWARR